MKSSGHLHGAGGGVLGVGMAFLIIGINGQPAFLGVAMAFVAIGVALLDKPRKERCSP